MADNFWYYARKSIFYEEIMMLSQTKRMRELLEIFGGIGSYKNIAVYGAGNIGKKYIKRILELQLCNIVVWVDKNYRNIKDTPFPVSDIEKLYESEFDHVIVTIANQSVAEDVRNMLVKKGISMEKIVLLH